LGDRFGANARARSDARSAGTRQTRFQSFWWTKRPGRFGSASGKNTRSRSPPNSCT
jgi:hypothetical protein